MKLFGQKNNIMDILEKASDGGIMPKMPSRNYEKEMNKPTVTATKSKRNAEIGDVIGVRRGMYTHFGVYINDYNIINYTSNSGDFGGNLCIQETTLKNFLNGSNTYFRYNFPEVYGKPSEESVRIAFSSSIFMPQRENWLKIMKKIKYRLYSPEETIQRARSRMDESKYNLFTNNCEHFAIWCKTGISESHQVNELLDILPEDKYNIKEHIIY